MEVIKNNTQVKDTIKEVNEGDQSDSKAVGCAHPMIMVS